MAKPATIGMTNRKIIVVACIVNIWLYFSADRIVPFGPGELGPDEQRLDTTEEEEEHGRDAVHDPELLVVDREHPRTPAGRVHGPAEHAVRRLRG